MPPKQNYDNILIERYNQLERSKNRLNRMLNNTPNLSQDQRNFLNLTIQQTINEMNRIRILFESLYL